MRSIASVQACARAFQHVGATVLRRAANLQRKRELEQRHIGVWRYIWWPADGVSYEAQVVAVSERPLEVKKPMRVMFSEGIGHEQSVMWSLTVEQVESQMGPGDDTFDD